MEDRKARLAALAAKAGRIKPVPTTNEDSSKVLHFRNYTPTDSTLESSSTVTTDEPATKRIKQTNSEKSVLEKALELAKTELPEIRGEEDVMMMAAAPKKINADLKRDIQPKLEKLERRTHKAIVALLRERLEREADAGLD